MPNDRVADQQRFQDAMKGFQRKIDGAFGIMIKNLSTQDTLVYHEQDIFPTASTLKVPMIYELYRQADAGEIDLLSRVTLKRENRVPGSGVLQHLNEGLQPTIRDLAELMIIVSDNYATDLLYNMIGGERLATTLTELGLDKTRIPYTTWQILSQMGGAAPDDDSLDYDKLRTLLRDSGKNAASLPAIPEEDTDYSSPADMVRMLELIENGHGLSVKSRKAIINILKHQNFNTIIPARLPDDVGIETAHKTGSVRGVRNDVGVVYASDIRYAIAIMSKDLADPAEAVIQFAQISRWVWDQISTEEF